MTKNSLKKSLLIFVSLVLCANFLKAQEGLVGHWTFDDQSNLLKATIGNDLELVGSHKTVNGPDSTNGAINIGIGSYYIAEHNISPNGGGTRVNEFTIVMDIKVPHLGEWYTLYQISLLNNDDGEWFFDRQGRMGVRATGYTDPIIVAGKWCRLAMSVKNGERYDYYLNGQLVLNGQPNGIDERFSLGPTVLLFADENQEDNPIDVAEIKMYSRALGGDEIASLGGFDDLYIEKPFLTVDYGSSQEIVVAIDPKKQRDYGFNYPVTYKVGLPSGNHDLTAEKRNSNSANWTKIPEKYSHEFYNGIEVVRFDYLTNTAFVSAAFSSHTDSLMVRIVDQENEPVPIKYQEICQYYDNSKAAVTGSADDWADSGDQTWYQCDEEFQITCRQFRKYNLWLSCGIITQYCNPTTWQHIQTQLDSGYVEACSHSRTHSYGPYDDPVSEIAGSKQDIFDNLDLPPSFKSGDKEYMYTWIAPANYYDEIVNSLVGENQYLVNRRYNWPFDRFSQWNYDAGYYHTIGISREASPIWVGTTDLVDLNSYYDEVVAKGGIYHLMTHPYFLLEEGFDAAQYAWDHLEHISNKTDIWYTSVGHLYLYHYLHENAPLVVSVPKKQTIVKTFSLGKNYPNPFNAATFISFEIQNKGHVRLAIYNTKGQLVDVLQDEEKNAGKFSVQWDAENYSSGVYFYQLLTDDFSVCRKCLLIK
jgi:hypothetical protein